MTAQDPYVVLGLRRKATPAEIRAAFRRAVRVHHPDTALGPPGDSEFRDAVEAYHLLIDPETRARFDRVNPEPVGFRKQTEIPVMGGKQAKRHPQEGASLCPKCGTSGVVPARVRCPSCGGQGRVALLETRRVVVVRCRTCRSFGTVAGKQPCPSCGGRGAVD